MSETIKKDVDYYLSSMEAREELLEKYNYLQKKIAYTTYGIHEESLYWFAVELALSKVEKIYEEIKNCQNDDDATYDKKIREIFPVVMDLKEFTCSTHMQNYRHNTSSPWSEIDKIDVNLYYDCLKPEDLTKKDVLNFLDRCNSDQQTLDKLDLYLKSERKNREFVWDFFSDLGDIVRYRYHKDKPCERIFQGHLDQLDKALENARKIVYRNNGTPEIKSIFTDILLKQIEKESREKEKSKATVKKSKEKDN